jgi:type VI secretion system secreted protein VgrG
MSFSLFKPGQDARRLGSRAAIGTALLALFVAGIMTTLVGGAAAAPTPVSLGTADRFAVLGGSAITNTGPSTIIGDVGSSPTHDETGYTPCPGAANCVSLVGTNHNSPDPNDAVTQQAKTDLITAYNTAAGEGPTSPISADLGGQTLVAGVYNNGSSIGLTGTLTLDGQGDPNAIFVFQAGSTLTTASASRINLTGGAQSCNVFWQVGSSATLGTGSTFRGTILALTSITVTTGVTVDGRVLARNGAVTLDTDTIIRPTCDQQATTSTAAATTAPATTATTAATTTAPATTTTPATTATGSVAGTTTSTTSTTGTTPTTTTPRTTPKADKPPAPRPPITHVGLTG